jgi:S-adenosylmethionine/arginine decarboxylase-like enzyme
LLLSTTHTILRKEREPMQHLLLDLYECSVPTLADERALRRFLEDLPARLGMPTVGPTSLYYIDAVTNPDDAGHSGLILAAQHVSLHAWPPYRMVNIDIFARDPFDEAAALAFARATFAPGEIEVRSVQRATRSPRPIGGGSETESTGASLPPADKQRLPPNVPYRCLWPGGCLRSTGSALMKYCAVHQGLLLPP